MRRLSRDRRRREDRRGVAAPAGARPAPQRQASRKKDEKDGENRRGRRRHEHRPGARMRQGRLLPQGPDDAQQPVDRRRRGREDALPQGGHRASARCETIVHGTTTATNITIEHNGSECGMLTTEGFRDILHIGRHKRPYNFSLHFDVPWQSQPLVKRRNRISIPERVLPPTGAIETPLDEDGGRARPARSSAAAASSRSSSASCSPSSTTPMSAAPGRSSRGDARSLCYAVVARSPT